MSQDLQKAIQIADSPQGLSGSATERASAYALLSIATNLQELVAIGNDIIALLVHPRTEIHTPYTVTLDDPNVSAT